MRLKKLIIFALSFVYFLLFCGIGTSLAETEQDTEPNNAEAPHEEAIAEIPSIYLRVGQRYPIQGLIAREAKISPEGIASAYQTPEGTLLVAKQTGQANLSLETNGKRLQIRIIVRDSQNNAPRGPWDQTLAELKSIPGVTISTLGGKTVIQGEILGRMAYQRVLLHMRNFPANILTLALPSAGIKASLIEQAHSLLSARGLNDVSVINAGNRFFLEGRVSTPEEVEHAFETVQSVIPNIENHLAIPIRIDPTISVRVFILELSRQAHQALGLSWPASTRQALTVTNSSFLFNPSWAATIQHFSSKGLAKVLAEPMLAVKNGSSAELSAGGEIPIRITGLYENKVIWKHYGLKIRLSIGGIAGKHIRTKIDTESSQLDEAASVDGVPGLRSNRMSTEVDALEGRPILLTGVFQSSAAKDVSKVPILGDIPILGELFKSRRFRDHESELLVALLPNFGTQESTVPLESRHGLDFDFKWRIFD